MFVKPQAYRFTYYSHINEEMIQSYCDTVKKSHSIKALFRY